MEHTVPLHLWSTPQPLVAVMGLLDRAAPAAAAPRWQKVTRCVHGPRAWP
jgi:hypothetical protein